MSNEIWTIVGGGNGGQTFAGHMAMLGKRVRLYSKSQEKVDAINETRVIELQHDVVGKGEIEFATTDLAKALNGSTHVVMILPSNWHYETTKRMIPYLKDGMYVLVLPEASCGAISFRKALRDAGCKAKIILGAGCTLPYATRSVKTGVCYVVGLKKETKIAALPSADNKKLMEAFSSFPYFVEAANVVETSIDNINSMVHPTPVLLNIARFEAIPTQTYQYYIEGFTPSICNYLERIDDERIQVAKVLGINQRTLKQELIDMYQCGDDSMTLCEVVHNNHGYFGIMNPKSLNERYTMEDLPYSLVAIHALGEIAGVKTPYIDAIITLGRGTIGEKLEEGRTLKNLGLEGMTKDEFLNYIRLGGADSQ